jgi:hypothetical protein
MRTLARQVHQRCPRCGRLLVPVDGDMPRHRRPARKGVNEQTSQPLTGLDAPWCERREFSPHNPNLVSWPK